YVRGDDGSLIAVIGLDDLVLVVTDDAVFAASRARAQDVKLLVERLKRANRPEADLHTTVYRPWGSYQSVDAGSRFQVKRLTVKPGAKLSAQMHHHRAEHWVVVAGTAKVLRGEDTVLLSENQSIYIPIGTVHRLENPGKVPLHLIEVQSGSYLGEDDIVRFQDDYGRG
ncbi:MAG: cupin domain-containing protein, partial [Alphaproteobacteria bacterium]|nr:cupin domain-containing protein [Alphaproteobacteria bacterium]